MTGEVDAIPLHRYTHHSSMMRLEQCASSPSLKAWETQHSTAQHCASVVGLLPLSPRYQYCTTCHRLSTDTGTLPTVRST